MYRKPPRSDAGKLAVAAIAKVREVYPTVHPADEDVEAALALLERFAEQKLTLTDATIASMAARAGARVMTFDARHFALMGASIVEEA